MSNDFRPLRPGSDPVAFFRLPHLAGSGDITKGHMMAAALCHALRDGEVVVIGANPLIPLAAARLAQLTHAPNLTILVGASGGVNTLAEPLAPSSGDYANLIGEAVLDFPSIMMLQMSGHTDVFFAGGLQIDRRGNCNLVGVGDPAHPTLRGPGSAGLPWSQRSERALLYTGSHTVKVFVPQVDFVSAPGWPVSAAGNVRGPELVVTPLAVMDFTSDGEMRLASVHPGVSVQEVVENTGFELALPEGEVPTTPEPTPTELEHMRQLDVDGLLAIVV